MTETISGWSIIEDSIHNQIEIWFDGCGEPPKPWKVIISGLTSYSQAERVAKRVQEQRNRQFEIENCPK